MSDFMDDHYFFKDILIKLKNSTHPEVYHFRNGNHPGPNWYLKTVCPTPELKQIDRYGYGKLWLEIRKDYPDYIKIVPQAYDWNGNEIPYMVSVWLVNDIDIIMEVDIKTGLNVMIVDRIIGEEFHIEQARTMINQTRDRLIQDGDIISNIRPELEELDNIDEILDCLQKSIDHQETSLLAQEIRKEFRVHSGGKNNIDD